MLNLKTTNKNRQYLHEFGILQLFLLGKIFLVFDKYVRNYCRPEQNHSVCITYKRQQNYISYRHS